MAAPRNVNDGSSHPPRLGIYANEWAMLELPKLPRERAWSFAETAEKVAQAGFMGIQAQPAQRKILEALKLRFATSSRVNTPAEARAHIAIAAAEGADCTTLHVGWGMESDAEIDALIDAINDASAAHALPAYIETHRATCAQDLWRIHQFISRRPDVRFNGDFSHLYCGAEVTYPGFENFCHHYEPILQRVAFLHGRVSNGQSMQVDIGDGRDNPHVQNFSWLWERSMRHFFTHARPGDLLPFAPELGPPSSGYSITYRSASGEPIEISDRWSQTLVLKRIAEECWTRATQS